MKYFIVLLICCTSLVSQAQNNEGQIFDIYKKQYDAMITGDSRAPISSEYANVMSGYNTANLKSNSDFADLLKNLYPDHAGIGVLFFFYNDGVLHRTFFKPGKVLEEKQIQISIAQLTSLNNDLLEALQVVQKAESRSPIKRGVKVTNTNPSSRKVSLDAVTNEMRKILLPTHFDTTFKQLIIIPALNIGTFPFQMLKPYGNETTLMEECSITISPGVIDLIASRTLTLTEKFNGSWTGNKYYIKGNNDRNEDIGKENLAYYFTLTSPLFISNPAYPKNLEYDFPDLPSAKQEIDNALKYSENYKLLEGNEAKKDSIAKYWEKADLIYFATHGIADLQQPMLNSYLVLSGADPKLTARDIMNLAFQRKKFPEMVILSACQSGLGKSMDVGVLGVARSFIIGGSKQVIMSLWNVDDQATAFLMNRFLYHLQTPHRFMPSEPLRLAMLDTKAKYPNPIYWASFSVFGLSY